MLRPLNELAARGRISLTLVDPRPDGFVDPADVAAAVRANTRLIVMPHASNVTGAIQPVAAVGQVARERGVRYLIDGAQALGRFRSTSARCAATCTPFRAQVAAGPQGTGGLYVRPGVELFPLREGGTGSASDSMLQPKELPDRYESGTLNLPGIAGLGAGCAHVAARLSQIVSRERELTSALREGLSKIEGAEIYSPAEESARTGIVCFNLGDLSSSEAADAFARADVAVRGGLHCAPGAHRFLGTMLRGAVRASVSAANTFEEVERFLRTAREILVDAPAGG